MKKLSFTLVLVSLLTIGCGRSIQEIQSINNSAVAELIKSNTPAGNLYRYWIVTEHYSHAVYFFDKNTTVSVNYQVPQGKTTRTETVVIGGVEYVPVKK